MAKQFLWNEECAEKIEKWSPSDLKVVHMAMYAEATSNNLVRRKLRNFPGFEFHNEEKRSEYISELQKEMSLNELHKVSTFLGIESDENAVAADLANKIVESLAEMQNGAVETTIRQEASKNNSNDSLQEELDVRKKICKIDEQKLQIEIQIGEKKRQMDRVQQQRQQEDNADNIAALKQQFEEAESELQILQASKESLASKRQCLITEVKIIDANSSVKSISEQSATVKVSSWLRSNWEDAAGQNRIPANASEQQKELAANLPPQNQQKELAPNLPPRSVENKTTKNVIPQKMSNCIHSQETEIRNLQQTMTSMLARQTIGKKYLEFDGSSAIAWQNFLTQFRISSNECNFTPEEDLYRLDRGIKGAAREKVELMIMSATHPEKIIAVLDDFYGGPEHIAFELVKKAEKQQNVQNMESFQNFNCLVQNILAAMERTNSACIDQHKLLATLMSKLPETYLKEWGAFMREKQVRAFEVSFNLFCEWCQQQSSILHDMAFFKRVNAINSCSNNSTCGDAEKAKTTKSSCEICHGDKHELAKCPKFLKANDKQRWDIASKAHVCFCCLRTHKGACNKREVCNTDNCQKFHHKMLHKKKPAAQPAAFTGTTTTTESRTTAMLKVLPIRIFGSLGSKMVVALLDEGSTSTMLDMNTAKELGIQGKKKPFCFYWTDGVYRHEPDAEVANLFVSDIDEKSKFNLQDVCIIPKLNLPKQNVDYEGLFKKYPYLGESKMQAFAEHQPQILIGQRHANLITTRQIIEPDENSPILSKTKLGWAVHGPVKIKANEPSFLCCQVSDEQLQQLLKQQYSLESFGVCKPKDDKTKSLEDRRAIEIAQNSIRKIEGRFQVKLPWREDNVKLPESKPMALQRLYCLERKLQKDKNMAAAYQKEIEKLLESEYATEIKYEDVQGSPRLWFLPHFPVYNPNKPGKVRLVFDAAAKCNGTSLNDKLLTGPDWLTSIVGILMCFRLHPIAFAGDIKEMFNQVRIEESDAAAQCFLWRNINKNIEPKVYQMKAMLFGTCSSPFLAQFVKNHNAELFKETEPEASKAIVSDHYVDDYLSGAETVEKAVENILAVIRVHQNASFKIQRFISNDKSVLKNLPPDVVSEKMNTLIGDKANDQQKVLGILWDAEKDVFRFSRSTMHQIQQKILKGEQSPTKRKVLATINSVYDPVGLVTPITIRGRLLMREVWESGIHWDDEIKKEQLVKWQRWLKELANIEQLQIRRLYTDKIQKTHRTELHVFNDASSQAYAAVAYLRWCYMEGDEENYDVAMITSKARVAPLKHTTIPKLETLAAVMGCRLAQVIQKELGININQRFFWSDSKTVLTWIKSEKKLQVFVANRISEICELSTEEEWWWLPTTHNAADLLTRGNATAEDLAPWLSGPGFLKQPQSGWPGQDMPKRTEKFHEITMMVEEYSTVFDIIKQHASTLSKAVRVLAWVKRFIHNAGKQASDGERRQGELAVNELQWAKSTWYKTVQQECFQDDVTHLQNGKRSANLKLTKYDTFLDENGVMRLSGRIERAKDIDYRTKNPIVMDGKHYFTKLIIEDIHRLANHTGTQVAVHKFKEEFWMPKITNFIKKQIRQCLWCKRHRSKPIQPQMGLLPYERFHSFEKPFSNTGVDYFGPFYVRDKRGSGGRYGKSLRVRYGALFTCLTTRAIHVEITHSLSTDSCIMALRRMMSRRGSITTLWSDNGTNFRGASRELVEAMEEINEDEFGSALTAREIEWKFIPAHAPNFGGCWERMVGCFKKALESVLCLDRNPTDEMLLTIFNEAEHLVNSRPYILESDDPTDDISLTPNDILVSENLAIYSPGKFTEYQPTERRMWRVTQALIDQFWHRFLKEYIPTLINRCKWQKNTANLSEGDVVVIKTSNLPRGEWPLGIVIKVHPGSDDVVRVVDVKTAKNTYRRPASALCRLNLQSDIGDRADESGSRH